MKSTTKAIGLSILSAFILAACEDTTNGPQKKTAAGIGIGAATGALAGIIIGDNKDSVVVGTVAGAVIGGLIGNSLDRQEAELRDSLSDDGTTITNTGSELIVTLPEGITFDTDSTYVRDSFRPEIYKIASNLQNHPDTTIDVIGHTDSTGDASYNQALSTNRANSVTGLLTGKGVSHSRIASYGRGETSPIASNDTESGKAQNRRVEIVIRPTT